MTERQADRERGLRGRQGPGRTRRVCGHHGSKRRRARTCSSPRGRGYSCPVFMACSCRMHFNAITCFSQRSLVCAPGSGHAPADRERNVPRNRGGTNACRRAPAGHSNGIIRLPGVRAAGRGDGHSSADGSEENNRSREDFCVFASLLADFEAPSTRSFLTEGFQ